MNKWIKGLLIGMAVASLVACGGEEPVASVSSQDEEKQTVDASVEDAVSEDLNLLEIRFHGHSYNLNTPFSQIVSAAQNNGDYIGSMKTGRLINADGSDSETRVAGNKDIDSTRVIPAEIKIFEDGFCATTYYFELDRLDWIVSADGISKNTKDGKIPNYYVPLGAGNSSFDKSYAVILKDGLLRDIQDYVDQLPETMTSQFYEEVSDNLSALQPIGQFKPLVFSMPWKETFKEDYDASAEFRNNIALLQAVRAAWQSVQNGENQSMAVIQIIYKDGKVRSIYYSVFRNMSADTEGALSEVNS